MTDDPRAAAFEMSDEALKAAMLNHGAECRRWMPMPPSRASSDCAHCGLSARAHVVTKLIDYIHALKAGRDEALERYYKAKAEMADVSEIASARLKAAPPAEGPTWQPLRGLHDAIVALWGHPEDCEFCAACEEHPDLGGPCQIHGSAELFTAILAAEEALGQCRCGHTRSEHHSEDSTACRACSTCQGFRLPTPPRDPAGKE